VRYLARRVLPTRGIADILGECRVVQLHPDHQLAVVVGRCPDQMSIDEAERRRAILIQGYLVIQQVRGLIEVLSAKFHVEDAVGSSAARGGKNSTAVARGGAASGRALVGPIRSQHISSLCARPAGDVRVVVWRPEGQVAVRPHLSGREGLIVQSDRERQCNCGAAVVAVVADVGVTRHERSTTQSQGVRRYAAAP